LFFVCTSFFNTCPLGLLKEGVVNSSNGKASWNIEVKYPDWGRYLVIAEDTETGHSTGKIVYIDWPGWAGRAQKGDAEGASMLTFVSDKEKYNVGDDVKITIPTGKDGRALISIEDGTDVLKSYWVQTKEGETQFEFKATKEMTPNVYVHISLLQPHSQTANDLPIRMYGAIPIMVEDPNTILEPVIVMPNEIESGKDFNIEIDVRNPNHLTTNVIEKVLSASESWVTDYTPVGIAGTNNGVIEVSSIPPINLKNRLNFLIQYPHGCVEQTTSAVFPQLFVSNLIELNAKQKKEIEKNIKAGIKQLASFQLSNGGFAYWQGGSNASIWGTTYAGHFLIEAKKKGYPVSSSVIQSCIYNFPARREYLRKCHLFVFFQNSRMRNSNMCNKISTLSNIFRRQACAVRISIFYRHS